MVKNIVFIFFSRLSGRLFFLSITDKNGTVSREYDALNRVTKYIDTEGNTIEYCYDCVGNLSRLIYPDGSAVVYTYDLNNNLVSVTDWNNRSTVYSYDENNRVTRVVKPDGSVTTTIYDNAGRVISTVEKTSSGATITGFEYEYDDLGRIKCEKHLAKNENIWYTYDKLSRVISKTVENTVTTTTTEETFSYDAAGNLLCNYSEQGQNCFEYTSNNRLNSHNGYYVSYDRDGNITSVVLDGARRTLKYDSTNKLISAGQNAYTYNAENTRVKNLCGGIETTYVYDTNAKLSKLLTKTAGGVTTKYVYGRGLIGEETNGTFRTYHFDYRGSTVALTNINGLVTDTFEYDTYGKLTHRTGSTKILFMYNGRDGVVTDDNGLIYMRARYYSPELRRFINSDTIAGEITEAITLNRYAYANDNPVSFVDPFGLSADARTSTGNWWSDTGSDIVHGILDLAGFIPGYGAIADGLNALIYLAEGDYLNAGLTALSAIPGIGDIAGGAKWAGKLFKGANKVADGIGWLGKLFGKTDDIADITKVLSNGTEAIGNVGEVIAKNSDDIYKTTKYTFIDGGEIKLPTQIKSTDAIDAWNDFLGPNQTNINKFTGKPDTNRIFSQDGTKSIRFGNHEMNSLGTHKAHFHYENWDLDVNTNIVTLHNRMQRLR